MLIHLISPTDMGARWGQGYNYVVQRIPLDMMYYRLMSKVI